MRLFMAASAERDQVRFGIITAEAAKFLVDELPNAISCRTIGIASCHAAESPDVAACTVRHREAIAAAWVESD